MPSHLTTGVFNVERLGYERDGRGHVRLGEAVEWLLEITPSPPDVLAFPEATNCLIDEERPLRRELVTPLSRRLESGWYEPRFSSSGPPPGQRNHHYLLLLNTSVVHPLGWADVAGNPDRNDGFVTAEVFGHEMKMCCEHWQGGLGRAAFEQAANRLAGKGGLDRKTWLGGDFNATSSWEKEVPVDWQAVCEARGELDKLEQKGYEIEPGRWVLDTRQLDKVRGHIGFRDAGEWWGDPTPTTNHEADGAGLRIDRVFTSLGWPGGLISYGVDQPPRRVSDHAYVRATYCLCTDQCQSIQ